MTPQEDVLTIAAYGGFEIDSERAAYVVGEFAGLWPLLGRLNETDAGTAAPATPFIVPGDHGRRG
jgi:hypothetical protein